MAMDTKDSGLTKILTQAGYVHVEINGEVVPVCTEELDALQLLHRFETVTRRIIAGSQPIFPTRRDKRSGHLLLRSSQLSRDVLFLLMQSQRAQILHHFPHHDFTPYFDLFWKLADECELLDLPLQLPLVDLPDHLVQDLADGLNGWVAGMRSKGRATQFRAKVDNFRRGTNKAPKSFRAYLWKLLRRHPDLELVRIDLTYRKVSCLPSVIVAPEMTYEVATQHRQALVKFLQKSPISSYVLGYAWKLSNALQRGFNLHLLLMMKRSEQHAFSAITGEAWCTHITNGQGIYFDNARLGAGYRGSGIVLHNITEMAQQIDNTVSFMTWPDRLVKLKIPKRGRTFGKGQIKGERAKHKTRAKAAPRTTALPSIAQALQKPVRFPWKGGSKKS